MAQRRKNPRIPYSAFGEGKIPNRLKKRYKRRAQHYAQRQYNPQIRALQQQKQGIRKDYRRDVQSAKGAINFTQNAIEDVPLKGLQGRYKQDLAAEMASASKDVAGSFGSMKGEARMARNEAMTGIRQEIIDAKIDREKEAASTLNSFMEEARSDAEQHLNSRGGESGSSKKEKQKEFKTALYLANQAISLAKKKPWEFANADQQEAAWGIVAEEARGEGVSPLVAKQAIEFLRKKKALPALGSQISQIFPFKPR